MLYDEEDAHALIIKSQISAFPVMMMMTMIMIFMVIDDDDNGDNDDDKIHKLS
jgi:hypothetical protein